MFLVFPIFDRQIILQRIERTLSKNLRKIKLNQKFLTHGYFKKITTLINLRYQINLSFSIQFNPKKGKKKKNQNQKAFCLSLLI